MESGSKATAAPIRLADLQTERHITAEVPDLQAMNLERLQFGISIFSYLKRGGGVRVAVGTLNPLYMTGCTIGEYNKIVGLLQTMGKVVLQKTTLSDDQRSELQKYLEQIEPVETDSGRGSYHNQQVYWDLSVQDWRSYTIDNIVAIFDHAQ